jgi:hypothetical protein
MKKFRLEGIEEVTTAINKELARITVRTARGMIEAAAHLKYSMDRKDPKIPADTGKLRASWFTDVVKAKHGPGVLMGFNANYAVWVHELGETVRPNATINWNRPGSGAKFLQEALFREQEEIVKIIAEFAAVG